MGTDTGTSPSFRDIGRLVANEGGGVEVGGFNAADVEEEDELGKVRMP